MKTLPKLSRRDFARGLGLFAGSGIAGAASADALRVTPSQVEGPFHPIDPQDDTDLDLVWIEGHDKPAQGEQIKVHGRVLDTSGKPIEGALVDVWQANHFGRYSHPDDPNTASLDEHFQGWGLLNTDASGKYSYRTIKPGAYPLSFLGGDGWRCRHVHYKVSAEGYKPVTTQMYFEGDPLIEQDLEIRKVAEAHRHLLIATSSRDESGIDDFEFDVVLERA